MAFGPGSEDSSVGGRLAFDDGEMPPSDPVGRSLDSFAADSARAVGLDEPKRPLRGAGALVSEADEVAGEGLMPAPLLLLLEEALLSRWWRPRVLCLLPAVARSDVWTTPDRTR